MDPRPVLLILGGTQDARALATPLADDGRWRVITSLAGRTTSPRLPVGEVISGGFGGALGLAAYLRRTNIAACVDATHPFASRMGWNAAQACREAGVPLLRLERAAWNAQTGDRWENVPSWEDAVTHLRAHQARRVLLALGRQDLEAFTVLDQTWFLIRSVEAPDPMPPFAQAHILLARGPFDLDAETRLLRHWGIDTIVAKNSGGPTDAKLAAARALGIRVILRDRPPRPDTDRVETPADAVRWVLSQVSQPQDTPVPASPQ